jgi:hypothetical protein
MKKILTLSLVLSAILGQAQIFSEDFNAGIPTTFTLTDVDGLTPAANVSTFTGSFTAQALGSQDCAGSTSWFNPLACCADDWMTTPSITLPNNGNGIGLEFDAIAPDANFSDGVEVYVSTTGATPANFTTPSIYNTTNTGGEADVWTKRSVDLTSYAGQTIYIAFRNNSNDQFVLGIDNIIVNEMQDNNAELSSLNITPYSVAPAIIDVEGVITNVGGNTINAMDITWTDGANSYTDNYIGLNIAANATYNFTHADQLNIASPGSANLTVTIDNVNTNIDPDMSNNTLSTTTTVVTAMTVRRPLIETFTSSTCPPCAPANVTAEALFAQNQNIGKFTSIKYQADFPGAGDPYFTQEGGDRRSYYGITSVPRMEIDGGWDENGNNITQQVLDDYTNIICLMNISATYSINNKTIDVDITVDPLENFNSTNLVVHSAIIEETTYNNTGTNGETQFEHVVKKMLPDNNGTALASLTGGTPSTLNQSYTFNGNYRLPPDASNPINDANEHSVEDFSNLMVAVWVQDEISKEVHQSTMATLSSVTTESWDCVNNACIDPMDGTGNYTSLSACQADTACITAINEEISSLLIYPNPVKNRLVIEGEYTSSNIYDIFGKAVLTTDYQNTIDVTALSSGIYFINIKTNNVITIKKITIAK